MSKASLFSLFTRQPRLAPEAYVPDYTVPIFMAGFYRQKMMNDFAATASPAPSIRHSIRIPDHDFLRNLQRLEPETAKLSLMVEGPENTAAKLRDLAGKDRLLAGLICFEYLHDSLHQDDRHGWSALLQSYPLSEQQTQEEDRNLDVALPRIIDRADRDGFFAALIHKHRVTAATARDQYILRRDFMQMAADQFAAIFQKSAPTVVLDIFPETLGKQAAAWMIPKDAIRDFNNPPVIAVNYRSDLDDPAIMIERIAHEMRHHIDGLLSQELMEGSIAHDDPRLENAVASRFNFAAYIQPEENQGLYYRQYVERSAYRFGGEARLQFNRLLPGNQLEFQAAEFQKAVGITMY